MPRNKEKNENLTKTRKEEILRTAIKKFSEKGYQGTNVSEIAKELGVSQGMIFWYFETKERLFQAAFLYEFKVIKLAAANVIQDSSFTPLERLRKLISEMIKVYYERKEGCMLILQMLSNTDMQQILSIDIINVYNELYSELELLFREAGAANPELKARNFVALLDGFMIQIILGFDIGNREILVKDILHRYELI
ncbi:TetR/AcrR family transcriptional regulator [Pseudobacteroides cellulosolvens]|uniref:Transcriptional regulator, TetR family n=1 Tax=Pseudobacteroides cellulosolvens ATCC 35603 = DSM 2933 TaxID=398512 RepID=A0A0L6JIV3_9FIRM|nr:TetR/AcrR family transcriptional regulator [Pseudobacteroides cellulosolvens]KNY25674.1 transcriptional regulator, TetR family [Pseudobacteroides cellulosolvens ATCC 35603 = DSM 2933]